MEKSSKSPVDYYSVALSWPKNQTDLAAILCRAHQHEDLFHENTMKKAIKTAMTESKWKMVKKKNMNDAPTNKVAIIGGKRPTSKGLATCVGGPKLA